MKERRIGYGPTTAQAILYSRGEDASRKISKRESSTDLHSGNIKHSKK